MRTGGFQPTRGLFSSGLKSSSPSLEEDDMLSPSSDYDECELSSPLSVGDVSCFFSLPRGDETRYLLIVLGK